MEPIIYRFKHDPEERNIANLPWRIAQRKSARSVPPSINRDGTADTHCICGSRVSLPNIDPANRSPADRVEWSKMLESAETQARLRAVQMHFNTITTLPSLPVSIKCCEDGRSVIASATLDGLHTDEIDREWIYDTGAATCCIGWDLLTADEKSRVYSITPMTFTTANGLNVCSQAVDCNIPFLGKRQVHVLKGSPAAISATESVMHYGITLTYNRDTGASVTLPDGTVVYLEERSRVPMLDGHCRTENAWSPKQED